MELNLEQEKIARIAGKLAAPHCAGKFGGDRTVPCELLKDGWGLQCDVQDYLWETDTRADDLARQNNDFDFLLDEYQLSWVSRYRRPKISQNEAWGGRAMRVEDIAMWIMEIERLGFTVDAMPLVERLRPSIMKQEHVTKSELAILWYPRERHRFSPITLRTKTPANRFEEFKTHSGYQATVLYCDEQIVGLRVDSPKGRKGFPRKSWIEYEFSKSRWLRPV